MKTILGILKDVHRFTMYEIPYTNIQWKSIFEDIFYKIGIIIYPFFYIKNFIRGIYEVTKNKKWKQVVKTYIDKQ